MFWGLIFSGIAAWFVMCYFFDMDMDTAFFICVGVGVAVFYSVRFVRSKLPKKTEAMRYSEATQTLTLLERVKRNDDRLGFEPVKDYTLQYHPAKQVYTGATVGGIHMGGFHEEEAYYTAKTFNTKKYELVYRVNGTDTSPINKIVLTKEMITEAENDPFISQFLDDQGNIIPHHKDGAEEYERGLQAASNAGRLDLVEKLVKAIYISKQLTATECSKINMWLCGKG